MTHHPDPRRRRHEFTPPVDALTAAVRLDAATAQMRARAVAAGPGPVHEDEPPTGLIDLAALRAAVAAGPAGEDVDPAAAAWLSGGPDPAAARVVDQVTALDPPHVVEEIAAVAGRVRDVVDLVVEDVEAAAHAVVEYGAAPDDHPADPVPDPAPVIVAPSSVPAPVAAPVAPETPPPAPVPAPVPRVFSSEHDRRPGWASRHDPRSLAFGLRERLGAAPLQDVDLPLGPVLDQGQEGECVGCGVVDATNVLRLATPGAKLLGLADAAALYHRAQQLDDVPGEAYTGTSVLAGMKAGVEAGWFAGYLWAFGTRDVASALAHGRPVVVGVPWLSGMYDTGPGGLVTVTGDDRGEGHCLLVCKLRMTGPQGQPGPYFGWLNSWGKSYGDNGIGWVHHRDLARLLAGVGEAAIPTAQAQS